MSCRLLVCLVLVTTVAPPTLDVPAARTTTPRLTVDEDAVAGRVDRPGAEDRYRVRVVQGAAYVAYAADLAAGGEGLRLRVLDQGGRPLTGEPRAGNPTVADAAVPFTGPYSGDVLLAVRATPGSSSAQGLGGAYSVGIDSDCAGSTATPCTARIDRKGRGRFTYDGEVEVYRVQLTAGHRYWLGYTQLDCTAGMRFLDRDGRVLVASASGSAEGDAAVPEPLTITAATSGAYYLDWSYPDRVDGFGVR